MKSRSSTISGLFWSFGERISAQIVTLVVSIFLARLLSPDQFAQIAIVLIFIAIANAFVTGGFGNSLIQKKDSDELDFSTTLLFSLGLSIIFYFVIFISAPLIAEFYKIPQLTSIFRILGLRIIIASINSIQHAYVSKRMEFKKFFYSTTIGTVASGVLGIGLALWGFGVWALVFQYLSNTLIDTVVLSFTCGWKPSFRFSFARMKLLFSYGWKLLAVSVTQTIYEELRGLVLSKKFNPCELSYYNQGDKFPGLFINNIDISINKVMFQRLCDEQDNHDKVRSLTRSSLRMQLFIMCPLFMFLAATSTSIITILLTEKWLPCVVYMKIICFSYLFYPIVSTLSRTIKALGHSGIFLIITFVRYCIGIFSIVLAINLFHNPVAVVFSNIIVYIVMSILCGYVGGSMVRYAFLMQLEDIAPSIIISIISFFVVNCLVSFPVNIYLNFVLQTIAFIGIYAALSLIFNKQMTNETKVLLKQFVK